VSEREELDLLRLENRDLRSALIIACDAYKSHRDERILIKVIRRHANTNATPFDMATVQAEYTMETEL
jgi:hypothetical protein